MEEQIAELFTFLTHSREEVREQAVKNVASLSTTPDFIPLFKMNDCKPVKQLAEMLRDTPVIAHDALSALINLSADDEIVAALDSEQFIYHIVLCLVLPKSVLAELYCMLLNNLSKNGSIREKLIPTPTLTKNPQKPTKTQHLDNLLEIFIRGESKSYNPSATFDFLAGVLANLAATAPKIFLEKSNADGSVRLNKLTVYTDHQKHKSLIRRDGVASVIKNCCFDETLHESLLREESDLLVAILLPLSGSEDYTDEEMDGMPSELQLLEPTKTREPDTKIRRLLLEALLLLSTSLHGRTVLRERKVYPVIQKLHLVENDDYARETIEKIVNLLMRDESVENSANEKRIRGLIGDVGKSEVGIVNSDGRGSTKKEKIDKDLVIEEIESEEEEEEEMDIEPLNL